ncbi:DUF4192 domain-containing protein [Streptomyces roseirectus]|uniref:DUF4192 domain-containing protein n=1 Tax=Streptomyces roseirectus TaxID=2768066 RepID=A0A7H0IAF3_9ACTN|nr:DUF4192 domain-containing protein [Streptomyces roseirectus]QNP69769.1 DUF4192 domain-containing protein [Streptomyces roseirectus]
MTNHSETPEPFDNGAFDGPAPYDTHGLTLKTPAELADAVPYLLGYRPEDSMVLVSLRERDGHSRFGARGGLGIPKNPGHWKEAARTFAEGLVKGAERRGMRPEQMVAYVCQEPGPGETGRDVMERLRPLAQHLRVECGLLDIPVIEALCVSGGRFWSYCCRGNGCCPEDGAPMALPGTSVLAAAATYAGLQVRGTLRDFRARMLPWETGDVREQEEALDEMAKEIVPRILDGESTQVAEETLALADRLMRRLAAAPPIAGPILCDRRDDALIGKDEAARVILGLQDRTTRDRAAEWMEGDDAVPALRLWRALARRCVRSYGEYAAAPLALVGWVAWSTGDELEAREALAMALGADPDYLFAALLHQACNQGLDPESIRRCLRSEREERRGEGAEAASVTLPGETAEASRTLAAEAGETFQALRSEAGETLQDLQAEPRTPSAERTPQQAPRRRTRSGEQVTVVRRSSRTRPATRGGAKDETRPRTRSTRVVRQRRSPEDGTLPGTDETTEAE